MRARTVLGWAVRGTQIALLAACGRGAADAPSVVLITCDTLRADRLGMYGWPGGTSPNLDALASESLVFDSAWSMAPLTGPSLSALLTGRTPLELGLKDNRNLLSAEARTLAEELGDAGWECAAVVSNWVLRHRAELSAAGVSQGFATFDDRMESVERNRPDLHERVATSTTDAALAWLDARRARSDQGARRPFFLWVHYQDPHGPYTPPEDCLGPEEAPASGEGELEIGPDQRGRGTLPRYQVLGDERRPSEYRRRYEAEIRYFDRELGRLVDGLRAGGLLERSLLVFTADHGESLGEHGYYFSHGQHLHRELVHVPLLIRRPGKSAAGTRVSGPVSHLDLWPTILGALGLPSGDAAGIDLLASSPPAVPPGRAVPQFLGSQWSLTDGRHRLLWNEGRVSLFDATGDPREESDIATRDPDAVHALVQIEREMLRRIRPRMLEPARAAEDPHEARELEALGYGGTDEAPEPPVPGAPRGD